jgi:hypothetical protein
MLVLDRKIMETLNSVIVISTIVRKPEMYVGSIGEVGFITAVREIIGASISGCAQDFILALVLVLAFISINC